ncbi:MAG: GWxTD domain-containing protein [Bacteroidetes bacterium]|jgi:GWxTD domain-containing protein|nr:GWxTD domain-containing protein [Bacteroidota bacterium]
MRKITITLFLLLCFCFSGQVYAQQSDVSEFLDQSRSQEEAGNIENALDTLFEARTTLSTPSLEVALEYMRLTANHDLSDHYRMAYAMYLWGLSADEISPNRDALEAEIERLQPIADTSQYTAWKKMLKEDNPEIYSSIRSFWNDINYLPTGNYNPRLVEHWRRIDHARETYTADELPPYGTDIRGYYYVKYGKPIQEIPLDTEINPTDIRELGESLNLDARPEGRFRRSSLNSYSFNRSIDFGEVHIWIYKHGETESDTPMALYFREKQNGSIEQITVIDDLIPSTYFSSTETLSLGKIIQMVYYRRLANYLEFAPIYNSMALDNYSSEPARVTMTSGLNFKLRNRAKTKNILKNAPLLASTDRNAVMEIPIDIRQYRVIDEENRPAYITYVNNRPIEAVRFDLFQNIENFQQSEDSLWLEVRPDYLKNYKLRNSLHLRTPDGKLISKSYNNPFLILDEQDDTTPSLSVFEVPYVEKGAKQIFYAELLNRDNDSNPAFDDLTLPKNLRGFGEVEIPQKDHFDIEPGNLLVSDLILGFNKENELLETGPLPFIASTNDTLPEGEPLVVHFEVYQLGLNDEGFSRFEVDYSFSKERGIFNLFGRTIDGISSTIEFEHDSARFSESLEIDSRSLTEGEYKLEMTVTDKITGQEVNRTEAFTILDESDFYLVSSQNES